MEKIIGRKVQELRKKRGLTQEQLAEMLELSPHYLSALERGIYNIKPEILVKIMNCLACSADELFCDVVHKSSAVTAGLLSEKLAGLPPEEQRKILAVVDVMIANAKKQ